MHRNSVFPKTAYPVLGLLGLSAILAAKQASAMATGYRMLQDYTGNFFSIAFRPARKDMQRTNGKMAWRF
ncbi:MAG: hypothetical protein ABIW76_04345 [Fibrobacteria bacterium]